MIKNIIILALAIISVLSLMWGFVEQGRTEEFARLANEQAIIAQKNAIEAMNQVTLAEEALKKCKESK